MLPLMNKAVPTFQNKSNYRQNLLHKYLENESADKFLKNLTFVSSTILKPCLNDFTDDSDCKRT